MCDLEMLKNKVIVFCCIFFSLTIPSVSAELIEEYFNYKNVPLATVFACSTQDYLKIMKSLMKFRTVASGQRYLEANVSFPHLMASPYYRMGVYLDYSCEFGKLAIEKSSEHYLLNETYVWFIKINTTDELEELNMYNFGLDSDAVAVVNSEEDSDVQLYDLYKINSTWPLITTYAGSWSEEFGLELTLNDSIVQRRKDFQGIVFSSTLVLAEFKFNYTKTDLENLADSYYESHKDGLSRMGYVIFTYLEEMFNFTVTYTIDPSWGYPNQKGPVLHDGMIGKLETRTNDLGMTPATMTIRTRMDVAHFTVLPIWYFRCFFLFRHPRTLGSYKALIVPFDYDVWILTIGLIFGIGVLLAIMKRFSVVKIDSQTNTPTDQTLSGNFVIALGALFQQGLSSCSCMIPERIVLLFTLIIGVMICTFYNSMIVTSLLQPPPKYIQTPQQLMDSSFKLIPQNHTYIRHFFSFPKDPLVQEIYHNKMKGNPVFYWPIDGMRLVKQSKVAFYAEEPYLYRIAEEEFNDEELCSLQEIGLERPILLQLPVKRNSPLLEFFNHGLLMMRETGIIYKQNKMWHPRKPHCQGQTTIPAVELSSVSVAFMIFLSGLGVSLFFLFVEVMYFKSKNGIHGPTKKALKKKVRIMHND